MTHLLPRRRSAWPLLLPVVAIALPGCGGFGSVQVDAGLIEPGTQAVCDDLLAALPQVVDDAVRRDVEPETGRTAAWGDPAIVLRCGGPIPAEYAPDAQLIGIDEVSWLPVDGDGGTFFSTVDREVIVEVAVPDDYLPEFVVLQDLAPAVLQTVPERSLI